MVIRLIWYLGLLVRGVDKLGSWLDYVVYYFLCKLGRGTAVTDISAQL